MQKVTFKQILKYNLLFWSAWLVIFSVVLFYQIPGMKVYFVAFQSSFFVTFPLFFLGLALWPLCRQIQLGVLPLPLFFVLHFILANIFTIIWLVMYYGLTYLVLGNLLFYVMDVSGIAGWQYPQGLLKYMVITGFYYSLIFYREIKERELKESQLRLSLREAEWKVLKSQLNPHFLFNALNSISALITSSPGSARQMLVQLSELLRRVLSENPSQTVRLEEELEFVHQYLDLEKIRLQDRLQYQENIDPALLSYPIPAMFLQPLLENAIKHGVSNASGGGWIRLKIYRENNLAAGSVENSFEGSSTFSYKKGVGQGATGLHNLQQRLALLYGQNVHFSAQPAPGEKMFRVQFSFPLSLEEKS